MRLKKGVWVDDKGGKLGSLVGRGVVAGIKWTEARREEKGE